MADAPFALTEKLHKCSRKSFLTLFVALGRMMTEKKECKSYGEVSGMLQIAIVEDEADLAQQTKDNVVRYLNEHGLEGNIAVFNDGMDIADNYKPIWGYYQTLECQPSTPTQKLV